MHYSKISPSRTPLRKFAAALLNPHAYPAWIDSGTGVPFSTAIVSPRVRDSLVLRLVAKRHPRDLPHARGAR